MVKPRILNDWSCWLFTWLPLEQENQPMNWSATEYKNKIKKVCLSKGACNIMKLLGMNILQVVEVLRLHTPYLFNLGAFATWQVTLKHQTSIHTCCSNCLGNVKIYPAVNKRELTEQLFSVTSWQEENTTFVIIHGFIFTRRCFERWLMLAS